MTDSDKNISVSLGTKTKQISLFGGNTTIDIDDVYKTELNNSDKYRMIFTINPVCSNVLFNAITEVAYNEEAPDMRLMSENGFTNATGETINKQPITRVQAIRDTEYSHPLLGKFKYYPGVDLLNNHLFRQDGFTSVMGLNPGGGNELKEYVRVQNVGESGYPISDTVYAFNTIRDFRRDDNFKDVKGKIPYSDSGMTYSETKTISLHLYDSASLKLFNDVVLNNIVEDKGWFGFKNPATINCPVKTETGKDVLVNKGLNYADMRAGDFIDLFPDRTRFSFVPHINSKQMNRLEYNWKYCLTYQCGAFDRHPIVCEELGNDEYINGLIFRVVSNYTTDSGRERFLLVSPFTKHNLKPRSSVRLYWGENFINITDVMVTGLGDENGEKVDYYFSIDKEDFPDDFVSKTGRFARLRFDTPCEYYFKILKRVPNFKELGDAENKVSYEEEYSDYTHDFDSEINKLAFASTIYGDDVVQIVYTDDIDIEGLVDWKGRKVSDLYLTIVKNNDGYKDWYSMTGNTSSGGSIENSSCFGKITAGLNLPFGSDFPMDYNVRCLHNISHSDLVQEYSEEPNNDQISPLCFDRIWVGDDKRLPKSDFNLDGDEITWRDEYFYGDLVEYSPLQLEEVVLEEMYHRFNSLQRETIFPSGSTFSNIVYDEIYRDDYEGRKEGSSTSEFACVEDIYNSYRTANKKIIYPGNLFPEGYFYKPHYKIHLYDENELISNSSDTQVELGDSGLTIDQTSEGRRVIVDSKTEISPNTEMVIQRYDFVYGHTQVNELYNGIVLSCNKNESGTYDVIISLTDADKAITDQNGDYYVFIKTIGIPDYATRYPDNSGKYVWRDLKKLSDVGTNSELYDRPFANGAHYVYSGFNFFVRRQDPDGEYGLNITQDTISDKYASANKLINIVRSSHTKPELGETLDYVKNEVFDLC